MTDCPVKSYDGCSCAPGECRSAARQIDDRIKHYETAVIDYQNAVFRAVSVAVIMICLAGLLALAALHAEEQFRRHDLRMQEASAQWRVNR